MTGNQSADRARRHWASGAMPSFFELISDAYRVQLATSSILRVRPVVVDADVLLKEVVAEVKRPGEIVLFAASKLGLLRIYVAEPVLAEVDRNLERVCSEAGRDYVAAQGIWSEWRKHIRVIPTPAVIPVELAQVHPKDIPTAVLSLMLGAERTWSNDLHLRRWKLAKRYPLQAALAARDIGTTELSAHLSLRISGSSVEAAVALARRAWLAAGSVGQSVILVALGVLLGYGLARRDQIAKTLTTSVPNALATLAHSVEQLSKWYSDQIKKIPPTPVVDATMTRQQQLARLLSGSALPATVPEIVALLAEHKVATSEEDVRAVLAVDPVFTSTGRWYWQLGK